MTEGNVRDFTGTECAGITKHPRSAVSLQRRVFIVAEAKALWRWIFRQIGCKQDIAVSENFNQIEFVNDFE